jgi:hypothetical protein
VPCPALVCGQRRTAPRTSSPVPRRAPLMTPGLGAVAAAPLRGFGSSPSRGRRWGGVPASARRSRLGLRLRSLREGRVHASPPQPVAERCARTPPVASQRWARLRWQRESFRVCSPGWRRAPEQRASEEREQAQAQDSATDSRRAQEPDSCPRSAPPQVRGRAPGSLEAPEPAREPPSRSAEAAPMGAAEGTEADPGSPADQRWFGCRSRRTAGRAAARRTGRPSRRRRLPRLWRPSAPPSSRAGPASPTARRRSRS